ncbi:MAG: response regulator [Oscillospiraceae bacterium]|nr:response regulator [Oscillospiraceae bacterium]
MKHNSNSYCYRVKGLFVPYATPTNIETDINNYVNKIERLTERLEDNYNNSNADGFVTVLEEIQDMLKAVCATECESHVIALLDAVRTRNLAYCKKFLQQSIADFLLLSIEMQKVQNVRVTPTYVPKYNEIERHEESARALAAIIRFLDAGQNKKAQELITNMPNREAGFDKLLKLLESNDLNGAAKSAREMESKHIERINAKRGLDSGGMGTTPKNILAVDDRPEILTSVSAALRGHYKVFCAPGGKQALQIADQHNIDFFILDIDMPEMDGFELARKLRSNPKYGKTPLVFLTATSSKERISTAIRIGSNDFIVKPALNVTLLAKAKRFIES